MRKFAEPTARNLLRRPLVLGVPFPGLLALAFASLAIFVLGGGGGTANGLSLGVGALGYLVLRVFSQWAKPGWEESCLFALECLRRVRSPDGNIGLEACPAGTLCAPDTLTETDLLNLKDSNLERIRNLKVGERLTWALELGKRGAVLSEVHVTGTFEFRRPLPELSAGQVAHGSSVYSLYRLPVVTDPLWLFGVIRRLPEGSKIVLSLCGVPAVDIKRRIEHARRSNAHVGQGIADVDSLVTFEEASAVLQGLSRGDEAVVEAALVVISPKSVELDDSLFCSEKQPELAVLSALGVRKRFHRSHLVRAVTVCDLIPNVCDPAEEGTPIFRTPRGGPLYFWPQDPRLEALHWLVVGASGSGKSFFTGLVLQRMVENGSPDVGSVRGSSPQLSEARSGSRKPLLGAAHGSRSRKWLRRDLRPLG